MATIGEGLAANIQLGPDASGMPTTVLETLGRISMPEAAFAQTFVDVAGEGTRSYINDTTGMTD